MKSPRAVAFQTFLRVTRRGETENEHTPGRGGQGGLSSVQFSDNSCCRDVARADERRGLQPEEAHGSGSGALAASVVRAGPGSLHSEPLAVARGFVPVGACIICSNLDDTASLPYSYPQISDSGLYPAVPLVEADGAQCPLRSWAFL